MTVENSKKISSQAKTEPRGKFVKIDHVAVEPVARNSRSQGYRFEPYRAPVTGVR